MSQGIKGDWYFTDFDRMIRALPIQIKFAQALDRIRLSNVFTRRILFGTRLRPWRLMAVFELFRSPCTWCLLTRGRLVPSRLANDYTLNWPGFRSIRRPGDEV